MVAQHGQDRLAHLLEGTVRHLLDQLTAEVGGHDQHGVSEVDRAPLAIGEPPVVEDLEQDVEHVRVRLLDLVEQHDRIGPPPHRFRQLPAFVIADVARRSAKHSSDGVLLLVLGHVEPDQGLLVVEQELGQRARELGLSDPGRAEKDE